MRRSWPVGKLWSALSCKYTCSVFVFFHFLCFSSRFPRTRLVVVKSIKTWRVLKTWKIVLLSLVWLLRRIGLSCTQLVFSVFIFFFFFVLYRTPLGSSSWWARVPPRWCAHVLWSFQPTTITSTSTSLNRCWPSSSLSSFLECYCIATWDEASSHRPNTE